jgi:GTP-binding protein EngB required for normal cell division/gas vesicle protein
MSWRSFVPISARTDPPRKRASAVVAKSKAATLLTLAAGFADDLEHLVSDYPEIEESLRQRTLLSVAEIRRRLGRDELWVAIVGEFKAGKSTFLNAVLGEPLLGSAKAEYTGVNTVIRYGPQCDYAYETERGTVVRFGEEMGDRLDELSRRKRRAGRPLKDAERREPSTVDVGPSDGPTAFSAEQAREARAGERRSLFRENVRALAAINRPGESVKSLTVWYPSPLLQTGLVFLDTPGINTPQRRFEQRAWEAIEREADACVLLTPVSQALSQKTREALARMRQYVPHIALVLTKMDKAESDVFSDDADEVKAQIDEVLRGAVRGFANEMGRPEDEVLWIATAAESSIPDTSAYSAESRGTFAVALERLTAALASERAAVIGVRAATIGATAAEEIRLDVVRVESVYARRIEKLEAERMPDPSSEAERLTKNHLPALETLLSGLKRSHAAAIDSICDVWMSDTEAAIRSRRNEDTLKRFAEESLAPRFETLRRHLDRQLGRFLSGSSEEITAVTTHSLEEVHKRYQIVANTSNVDVPSHVANVDRMMLLDGDLRGVTGALSGHSDEQILLAGGGVAAGAILGSVVLPVIGTVIGGILGALAGSLFGPDLGELKAKLIDKCRAVLESVRRQAKGRLNAVATKIRRDGLRIIEESLAAEVVRFARWIDDLLCNERRSIIDEQRRLASLSERARQIDESARKMNRISKAIAKESALMARSPLSS